VDERTGSKLRFPQAIAPVIARRALHLAAINANAKYFMKTTIATLIAIIGVAALGRAQDAHQRAPSVSFVEYTATGVTVRVTAGSQPLTYGFIVRYSQPAHGGHNVTFVGVGTGCSQYALPAFASIDVTIDGVTGGGQCVNLENPEAIDCASLIVFTGRTIGGGPKWTGFALPLSCE
jgi:hypothetical protein